MRFNGIARFLGYEQKQGKNGQYFILHFVDDVGKLFDTITKDPYALNHLILLKQLSFYNLEIDVRQGRYPSFDFISATEVNNELRAVNK